MSAGSTRLFIFSVMRPAAPELGLLLDAVGDARGAGATGATSSFRYSPWRL